MATTHQFDDKKANFKVLLSTAFGAVKREVDCRVVLTIHSVTNLPVLDGAYRVRWKFRDVDAKAARQQRDLDRKGHGDNNATSSKPSSYASGDTSHSDVAAASSSSAAVGGKSNLTNISPEERGATPYRNLQARDHSVTFESTVEVIAHMRVIKGELIGEPLKLVIERLTDENEDSGSMKFEPRVGHKFIDLAEFVNEGKTRRKYLLERSKTNAMVTISLEITTLKSGTDFKKPDLRQDHLLIGRKEAMSPPKRDRPLTPLNTSPNALRGDSVHPGLTRASSVTSSTSSRGHSYRGSVALPPTRSETEAVIEALFNPTIFTSKPMTPSRLSYMEVPQAQAGRASKGDDALTPRPRDAASDKNSLDSSDSGDDDEEDEDNRPQSERSKPRSRRSGAASNRSPSAERSSRRPSLGSHQPKTALDVALDMNHALDHNQTVRPRFSNHNRTTSSGGPEGSWEFVSFKDGSQGVKRKPTRDHHPERSGTGDSTATDFSTTSSKSHVSNTSTSSGVLSAYRASPELISSQSSGGSFGAPVVNIISETPTTATQEGFNINRGRWYKPKPFKKTSGGGVGSNASSRSSTPAPGEREKEREKGGSQPGRGGGRPSMDSHIGEQLRMLVIGDRPIVTPPGKINDGHEGDSKSKSGQVTPTPPKSDQAIVSVQ